jgi:DNA/RNA-binding domain of Phe-tRNA-synthetase-like protein
MKFYIEQEIFDLFPGMKIIAVVANGLKDGNTSAIAEEMKTAWQSAAEEAVKYENAQSHPNIMPWGERMKAAGAPRKKFPSSIEALVRRAGKGGEPVSIGPLVDFYNTISLSHIVPAGGYDIDDLQHGLTLRLSREGDTFKALDEETEVDIPTGEVSYADGAEVVTRHFVWKQSRRALITSDSRNVVFVAEVLGELPAETVDEVRRAFIEGLKHHFNVEARVDILDRENPEMVLT